MDLLKGGSDLVLAASGEFIESSSSHSGPSLAVYQSKCLQDNAFDSFRTFQKSGQLCDVVIRACSSPLDSGKLEKTIKSEKIVKPEKPEQFEKIDTSVSFESSSPLPGKAVSAHRIILAACSPYFQAMFASKMAESDQPEVLIHGVDENALDQLVDFCYTGQVTIDESNVQQLLPAACLLQLHEVQDACCKFLEKQLDPTNCLGIRAFADVHSCPTLLRAAHAFTQQRFIEVTNSEEFLLLPVAQLIDIIASDEVNVRCEEQVFNAVMTWVRHLPSERKDHLPTILQHVRLPLLSPKFLVQVSSDVLIKADETCRDLVDEAKNYLLLPQERPQMQSTRTRPRRTTRSQEVLYAVGGWCSGEAIASVERFDPTVNEWRMVAPMNKRRCGVGVAVLNNELLFAVGGHDGHSYLSSVERYDPKTDQWSADVPATSSSRTSVGVAVLDGALYAIGGQDGVSCLSIVERYDPIVNKWTRAASMASRRLGPGVAVLDGCLYAAGGSDGTQPLSTVERYDPRIGKWSTVAQMISRRKHLGLTAHHGQLYAVGGRDDSTELSTAEVFYPAGNQWRPIVSMATKRSGVGLAVVNQNLVAVGGFDGSCYLRTTEIYDADQNCWRTHTSMNYRRLGGGVGVLRLPSGASSGGPILKAELCGATPDSISNLPMVPSSNSLSGQPAASAANTPGSRMPGLENMFT